MKRFTFSLSEASFIAGAFAAVRESFDANDKPTVICPATPWTLAAERAGSVIASAHSIGASSARIARIVSATSGFAVSIAKSIALRFVVSFSSKTTERSVGAGFTTAGLASAAHEAGA